MQTAHLFLKKSGTMRKRVLIYFLLFFFSASFIGGSVFTTYAQFIAEGPCGQQREIVIPKGASLKKVARLLKKQNLIHSSSIFELGVRAFGNAEKIQAGEFSFPPYASAKMVMNILTDGTTYIRKIVIPEGWTVAEITDYLNHLPTLEGEILVIPDEGTLLPETYHYSLGDTRQSVIDRMKNAMQRALDEAWDSRQSDLAYQTKEQALVMASMIEKETSRSAEMPLVSSVFSNRLKKGMRLQSDPTVIYAITEGKTKFKRALTYKDLRTKSPYNTYVNAGLPPTPIACPGVQSLMAATHPQKTNYYYFVADGTGGHTFSATYSQHQKKVNSWRSLKKKN